MPENIPAVWITDGGEHSGWMDLNKFLEGEELVEHWQVLYCLLICSELVYQGVRMHCQQPFELAEWLEGWSRTPYAKIAGGEYAETHLPLGLHPMVPPSRRQLSAI